MDSVHQVADFEMYAGLNWRPV